VVLDKDAFDELVKRYRGAIYRIALGYVKNEADAQDVTQRVFVHAFERSASLKDKAAFKRWLYRIAVNLALNAIRDGARAKTELLATEPAAPAAEQSFDAEEGRMLKLALERLPPKQRTVVKLRIYDELSFREVGVLAECSEDSAKANYHHALKRLREMVNLGVC
jgi:RNA polymerase sigma-70 factor, ECF subfamily